MNHIFYNETIYGIQARNTAFKITTAYFKVNTERSKNCSHCFEVSDIRETSKSFKMLELDTGRSEALTTEREEEGEEEKQKREQEREDDRCETKSP